MFENKTCINIKDLIENFDQYQLGKSVKEFLEQDDPTDNKGSVQKSLVILRGAGNINSNINIVGASRELSMIFREGQGASYMRVPELGGITTDPDYQRFGSAFVDQWKAAEYIGKCFLKCLVLFEKFKTDGQKKRVDDIIRTLKDEFSDDQSKINNLEDLFDRCAEKINVEPKGSETIENDSFEQSINDLPQSASYLCRLLASNINFKYTDTTKIQIQPDEFAIILKNSWKNACDENLKEFHKIRKNWDQNNKQDEEFQAKFDKLLKEFIIVLLDALKSSIHLITHRNKLGSQSKNILIQGCGDVSMNFFNVAYLNDEKNKGDIISVPNEPLDHHKYSCLIAWDQTSPAYKSIVNPGVVDNTNDEKNTGEAKASADSTYPKTTTESKPNLFNNPSQIVSTGKNNKPSLSIAKLRFNRYALGKDKVRIITADKKTPMGIGNAIKYALYGQCLVWNGEIVNSKKIIHEFSDLRHVFRLPNLNKNADRQEENKSNIISTIPAWKYFFEEDSFFKNYTSKPRLLFSQPTENDVWLGEKYFQNHPDVAREACDSPVSIPLNELGGAPIGWVTIMLMEDQYFPCENPDAVQEAGDFSWDLDNPINPKLVWFPRENKYPCTLIGIGNFSWPEAENKNSEKPKPLKESDSDLFLLAWGNSYTAYSIFKGAKILKEMGAKAVLLIDEGNDVFHQFFNNLEDLNDFENSFQNKTSDRVFPFIQPKRYRIRGTLAFWTEK